MKGSEILTSIINSLGITANEFNSSLHQSPRSERVQNVLTGKTKNISRALAETIKHYYPQLSLRYILYGIGEMFVDGSSAPKRTVVPSGIYMPKYIINCLCDAYGINRNRLAKMTTIDRSVFSNLINPKQSPKSLSEKYAKLIIANVDHALSLEWLMYGIGPMYTDGRPDHIHPLYLEGGVEDIPTDDDTDTASTSEDTTDAQASSDAVIESLREEIRAQNKKIDQILKIINDANIPFAAETPTPDNTPNLHPNR